MTKHVFQWLFAILLMSGCTGGNPGPEIAGQRQRGVAVNFPPVSSSFVPPGESCISDSEIALVQSKVGDVPSTLPQSLLLRLYGEVPPDSFPPALRQGDLNGDGHVDGADEAIVVRNWNQTVVPGTEGDINGDGTLDGRT